MCYIYAKNMPYKVYLQNCTSKIISKQLIDYLDDNLFED